MAAIANVKVQTTDTRVTTSFISPVSPHKTVSKMPKKNVLNVINVDDPAEFTAVDNLPDLDTRRKISQYMTNCGYGVIFLAHPVNFFALILIWGHGFFYQ